MINIVFENDNFVVCDKPSGVLSTPARFEDKDTRLCLGTALQEQLGMQIYPVNRLDYEVSGIVLYAKNPEAHRQGNRWFEHKEVQKTYQALTTAQDFAHIPSNVPNPRKKIELSLEMTFEWKSKLLRGKRRAFESAQGKPSITIAKYMGASTQGYLRWQLQPVTGRAHQLRFDLSRHGFPIVGDKLYGSKVSWTTADSIALRSCEIDFTHSHGAAALGLPTVLRVQDL